MSTPSTDEYLEDQLALSRLDDDGAPPGPQARALARTLIGPPRTGRGSARSPRRRGTAASAGVVAPVQARHG
jgi:hypothetical protein